MRGEKKREEKKSNVCTNYRNDASWGNDIHMMLSRNYSILKNFELTISNKNFAVFNLWFSNNSI